MAVKLMIVDDEQIIRRGIESSIDWEELGIKLAAQASNGRDGLARALMVQPDIILTDVKMSIMNGIQMVQQIKEKLPAVHVVMISGYSDFQLTREAFKAGAVDYLLKPVSVEDLKELMIKLRDEVYREREQQVRKRSNSKIIHQALPVLRGEFLYKFIRREISVDEFRANGTSQMGFLLAGNYYQAMIMEYDAYQQMIKGKEDSRLLLYALSNIAKEILEPVGETTVCYLNEYSLFILVSSKTSGILFQIVEYCRQIEFYVTQHYKQTVTVGIGECVEGLQEFRRSFHQAEEAVIRKVVRGRNQVITYEDILDGQQEAFVVLDPRDEGILREKIKLMKPMEIQQQLNHIFEIYLKECRQRRAIQQFCIFLVSIILQETQRISSDGRIDKNKSFFEEIEQYETLPEMQMWVKNIYSRLMQEMGSSQSSQYKGIVKKSMEYAMAHYKEKLQVSDMAAKAYVTPNYFSKVFKQETGENFTEWLNKYRIEKAKERMAAEMEEKTYEIAIEVGFQDYKYFTYIFKKYTGYSPGNYRNLST